MDSALRGGLQITKSAIGLNMKSCLDDGACAWAEAVIVFKDRKTSLQNNHRDLVCAAVAEDDFDITALSLGSNSEIVQSHHPAPRTDGKPNSCHFPGKDGHGRVHFSMSSLRACSGRGVFLVNKRRETLHPATWI